MEAMEKFIGASFDVIRAGFDPAAGDDLKDRAAATCLALHTMLCPVRITPLPSDPASAPDVLDSIMSRLAPLLSTEPVSFKAPTNGEQK